MTSSSFTTGSSSLTGEDLLTQFREEGYLIVRNFAPEELTERMRRISLADVAALREPIEYEADVQYPGSPESLDAPGGRTCRRLRQALSRDPVFSDWVSYPPLVQILQRLLGSPVSCPLAHHNCVMTKHPRYSSETGWHRDLRFWNYEQPELVNVWLALGDEFPENGCLKLLPGTHRMAFEADRLDEKRFLRTDHPANQPLLEKTVFAELRRGDILLFHAQTFHAATRNFGDETKYSAVFTFHGPENRPIPGSKSASFPELILPEVID